MKIYLDDERTTPDGYTRVYWPTEAIDLLKTGAVTEISLDHDLGDDNRGTGYDVILWIEEQVALHGFMPPAMKVHSANVSARTKMESGIRAIEAMVKKRASNQGSQPAPKSCSTSDPACPACGGRLIDIRAKLQCSVCHRICETCCEGGRG